MVYRPLGRKLLCREIEVEEHYPDSPILLLEDRLKAETSQQAEIVAVGPGERDEEGDFILVDSALQPGVWIMHEPFRRLPVDEDGRMFLLHEDDVVAILG